MEGNAVWFVFNFALDEIQGGEGVVFDLRLVDNANALSNTDWIIYNVAADKIFSGQIFMRWTAADDSEYDRPFGFLRLGVNSAWLISCLSQLDPNYRSENTSYQDRVFLMRFSMDSTENRTYKQYTKQLFAMNCVIHSAELRASVHLFLQVNS